MKEGFCRICGEDGKKSPLQEHHISTDWRDNRSENKVILCATCHKRVHLSFGPSRIRRIQRLGKKKLSNAIARFNKKYLSKGGYEKLKSLARSPHSTLYDTARHFGVRSDSAVWHWVKKFGIQWNPVVKKRNIYSGPLPQYVGYANKMMEISTGKAASG